MAIEDVVVLKNDTTKRSFWKLAIVEELLTGIDGKVRTAVVKATSGNNSKLLRCSVLHLIPIEVKAEESEELCREEYQPCAAVAEKDQSFATESR